MHEIEDVKKSKLSKKAAKKFVESGELQNYEIVLYDEISDKLGKDVYNSEDFEPLDSFTFDEDILKCLAS